MNGRLRSISSIMTVPSYMSKRRSRGIDARSYLYEGVFTSLILTICIKGFEFFFLVYVASSVAIANSNKQSERIEQKSQHSESYANDSRLTTQYKYIGRDFFGSKRSLDSSNDCTRYKYCK